MINILGTKLADIILVSTGVLDLMVKRRKNSYITALGLMLLLQATPAMSTATTEFIEGHSYTWGINTREWFPLSPGRVITEAVLTFHNFDSSVKDQIETTTSRSSSRGGMTTTTTITEVPNYDSLSIYVLDNPRYGFQGRGSVLADPFVEYGGKLVNGVLEEVDSTRYDLIYRLGDTHSDNSPFTSIFNAPVALTLADGSSVVLSSALLEFIDYAGTGPGAGFGLWPGNVRYDYDDITLTLIVRAYHGNDYTTQTLIFHIHDDMNLIDENPEQSEID